MKTDRIRKLAKLTKDKQLLKAAQEAESTELSPEKDAYVENLIDSLLNDIIETEVPQG